MSAKIVFETIAHHAMALQPSARGFAIAATLRQLAELAVDMPLDLADAHAGYDLLCRARPDDAPSVVSRRNTCYELAQICRSYTEDHGNPLKLAAVFERIAGHIGETRDPRLAAICSTAIREAAELRAV